MRNYLSKGKSRPDAAKLIMAMVRRAASPASEKTRKALERVGKDRTQLEDPKIGPERKDRLALALTMLLRELSPLSPSPDLRRVYDRAAALAIFLTES
jgi:hypothetical protein